MRIAVGSDHAGYEEPAPYYKPAIIEHLEKLGHTVIDCGTNSSDPVDYPDIANKVSQAVLDKDADLGVLLCGTGIGMSMTANRHAGVRAAVCTSPLMARMAREHNNANVLCYGRRVLTLDACLSILDAFLEAQFSTAERHQRRVAKMG